MPATQLQDLLNDALPQTQCKRCGFADCRAYSQAIAAGDANIDQCPPGGRQGIEILARLTGQAALALNPVHGAEGPLRLALIDETACIGCTLCLDACPVDSIVGGPKLMHTVIASECTGCELCLPVCPVDCISLIDATPGRTGWDAWSSQQAERARERYTFRVERMTRISEEDAHRLAASGRGAAADAAVPVHSVIQAAVARARAKALAAAPSVPNARESASTPAPAPTSHAAADAAGAGRPDGR